MHFLRHELGPDVILSRGDEELAVSAQRVWCDAVAMEHQLETGSRATALELYRGALLPGFFLSDSPEFEQWLEAERTRLRGRACAAGTELAAEETARGNPAGAVYWARWATGLVPDDEAALRRLLEALLVAGDHAGATRAYREFAARLRQEYDAEPAPETRALVAPAHGFAFPVVSTPIPAAAIRAGDAAESSTPVVTAPVPVSRRSRVRWVYAAVALAALSLLAGRSAWRSRPRASPVAADAVAVLPFTVRGSSDLQYLREGMVDLLSAKLDGAPGLRSVDPRAVLAFSQRDGHAGAEVDHNRKVAERFGASYYVAGDLVEFAGRIQLSAALYDRRRDARPIASASVEGEHQAVADLVDQLAAQLLAARGGGRDTALIRMAGVTTRSLPALKAYLKGSSLFRAGREAEALEAFREAVTWDTSFALAYYGESVVAPWVSSGGGITPAGAAAEAARHADRLSPLGRELLRAYQTYRFGNVDSAEAAYRFIVAGHPDNVEGWFMLGETLFHQNPSRGRPFTEARPAFERVLALDSTDAHTMVHLARIAASEGKVAELDSLTRRFMTLHPKAERALEMRVLRAFALSDTVEQHGVVTALDKTGDIELDAALQAIVVYDQQPGAWRALATAYAQPARSSYWLASAHLTLGQVAPAMGIWREATPEPAAVAATYPEWPLVARALLSTTPGIPFPRPWLRALGDSVERLGVHLPVRTAQLGGLTDFQYVADMQPQLRAYLRGVLSARLGDTAAARRYVAELERLSRTSGDNGPAQLAHAVRAEVLWLEEGARAALAEVSRFRLESHAATIRRFWAGGHARFLKAELLHQLGRDEEALPLYASFPRESWDLPYLAPSHRRQAEIYERRGKRDEAIMHYARFVDLWKNAEPELQPLVTRARQALEQLRAPGKNLQPTTRSPRD